jgi:xanthosine utilization system XapX-like protein
MSMIPSPITLIGLGITGIFFGGGIIPIRVIVMNRQGLATISESYDSQDVGSNDRRDVGKVGSLGGPGHI